MTSFSGYGESSANCSHSFTLAFTSFSMLAISAAVAYDMVYEQEDYPFIS